MVISQVAIQLFTLRASCKTEADFACTMRRVREIGYEAVQISGIAPLPPSTLRSIAEGEGLVIAATHEPPAKILDEPEAVIERLNELGTRYTALPSSGVPDISDLAASRAMFKKADAAGAKFAAAGKVLTYHNHANEFCRLDGRRTFFHALFEETDPANLQAELDTYWVQAGGANPVVEIEKLAGRIPLLHIKDYAVNSNGDRYYAEIGYGNIDFHAVVAAADAAGCEWYIVEQDTCPGDPFESITKSFNYIRDNLVG